MKSFKKYITEQARPNMGDVFEFVFAAACVSKFADRHDDGSEMKVTPKSVYGVMDEYFRGNQTWQVPEGDAQMDQITLSTAAIPAPSMNYLRNKKNRRSADVEKMISAAIKAVENRKYRISKLSYTVITNMKPDDVDIQPAGTTDQKGTKSDVNIIVNGKVAQKISLKYGSRQMGQFSGADILQQLKDAWISLGVDIRRNLKSVEKAIPKLVGLYTGRDDPNYIGHDQPILFDAVKEMISRMPKKINVDALVNGVTKAMKGSEEDLEVVSGSFVIGRQFRSDFKKKLDAAQRNNDLFWQIKATGNSPVVRLVAEGNPVIDVRVRVDVGSANREGMRKLRMRTYIELGPKFKEYIES